MASLTGVALAAATLGACGGSDGSGAASSVGKVSMRAGPAAVNLSPGVVTVARLRTPAGDRFTLTLQRIGFQGREYVCLNANVTQPGRTGPRAEHSAGTSSSSNCIAPPSSPLAHERGIVAVRGDPTGCKPRPYQLVWGLARRDADVALASPTGERTATRRSVPAALKTRSDLFYVWGSTTPDHLVARDGAGKVLRTIPIHDTAQYFCR